MVRIWWRCLAGRLVPPSPPAGRPVSHRPVRRPPRLEPLEARAVPSFLAQVNYEVGASPRAVAVDSFTGAGMADLVAANSASNNVSVLLGNGDGSFRNAGVVGTGSGPRGVAVGDFTGTGVADLAVVNSVSNSVSVLLGNGDGSFQRTPDLPVGRAPSGVAAGDFTGSGILDLATANNGDGTVSVLLGNGDGTFQTARTFSCGPFPVAMAVGDFSGDGRLDLAVLDHNPFTDQGTVNVLLGNGDGTFQAAVASNSGPGPQALAVGDLNGDGHLDLVTANAAFGNTFFMNVLLGNGDGAFQSPTTYVADHDPSGVALGDLTGDGHLDMVTANSDANAVSVRLGNGDGTFQPAQDDPVGYAPTAVALADFNGDGRLDLAVTNGAGNTLSVRLGTGDGSFPPGPAYGVGDAPFSVAVGDLNGDGHPDLVAANNGPPGGGSLSVLLGNGDGTFPAAQDTAVGRRPEAVTVGDFNGDGVPDLAVANQGTLFGTVSVLLGNGDGSFQSPQTYFIGASATAVVVGDFSGNGILDLAVASFDNNVSVFMGNGDGSFQAPRSFAVDSSPTSLAVGDFNGDGILDLVTANPLAGDVSVLLGNGDGSFQAAHNLPVGPGSYAVTVGDFSGDGRLDLAVASWGPQNALLGSVSVLRGNGDGTFQAPLTYPVGARPYAVAAADLNGDGRLDLVVVNNRSNDLSMLWGNGDGTFQDSGITYATGSDPTAVAVADLNGDGQPDLAVTNATFTTNGTVSVFLNTGAGDSALGRDAPH